MNAITIKGEDGKSFGIDEVALSNLSPSGSLAFQSASPDRLSFVIEPSLITASGVNIPEIGQSVELFINGRREFKGDVTRVPASWRNDSMSISIEAAGPWSRLENQPLTDLIETSGLEVERPQFRCPKGDIRDHIIRILTRAITLGVPIQIGEIESCYAAPTTTFSDVSFGNAIAELMSLVPDSVAWFDYSGDGHPKFNLTRRDIKDPLELTIGGDDIISVNIEPEVELKVERVTVESATRSIDGSIQYVSANAGEGQNARQIVTVSGPELADILPPDQLDTINASTADIFIGGGTIDPVSFSEIWTLWRDAVAEHSPGSLPTLKRWGEYATDDDNYANGVVPRYILEDGSIVSFGDDQEQLILTSDREPLPSWFKDQVTTVSGQHKGTWYVELNYVTGSTVKSQATDFEWALIIAASWTHTVTGAGTIDVFLWFDVDEKFDLMEQVITSVDYYQAPAYTFETPPEDYAINLLAAQNFMPYSGNVDLQLQDGGFKRLTGATLNVIGGLKQWDSMGALIQGESLDLENGIQSLEIGVPNRRAGSSSITLIKRDPSDNVVLL